MMKSTVFLLLALAPAVVLSFAPTLNSLPRQCPGALMTQSRGCRTLALGLRMQEDGEKKEPIFEDDIDAGVMKSKSKANSGGVSDSMKARLLKESQALGGDPNVTPVNWAVVIGGVIGGLAVVGSVFGAFGRSDPSSPF